MQEFRYDTYKKLPKNLPIIKNKGIRIWLEEQEHIWEKP
jgi:hypothetical protein